MIQQIIDGIISAIRQEFETGKYKIYTEQVEQGLKTPCFSIMCLKSNTIRTGTYRSRWYYPFVIVYLPQSELEPAQECADVYEKLVECLNEITVNGNVLYGNDMGGETVDKTLNFLVSYDLFSLRKEEAESMDSISEHSSVK